jgi:hypothetical protein
VTIDGERHISIDLTAEQWSYVAGALERWTEQGLDALPDYELRYGGTQLADAYAAIRAAVEAPGSGVDAAAALADLTAFAAMYQFNARSCGDRIVIKLTAEDLAKRAESIMRGETRMPPEPCCTYRDHSPGPCACPEHERSALHPFGGEGPGW